MDDDDAKIRRNLVVTSMLVLALIFLGVGVDDVLKKVIGTDVAPKVHAWRAWLVVVLVLVYQVMRYRFSDEYVEAFDALKVEWQGELLKRAQKVVAIDIWHGIKSGTPSAAASELLTALEILRSRLGHVAPTDWRVRNLTFAVLPLGFGMRWEGQVAVGIVATRTDGPPIDHEMPVSFDVTRQMKRSVMVRSAVRMLAYSRSSTRFLLPAILALVALLGVVSKLVMSLVCP